MAHRIEVAFKIPDTRAEVRKSKLKHLGFSNISDVSLVDVYTIDVTLDEDHLYSAVTTLTNPVIQKVSSGPQIPNNFDWAIEIGFLPGVTDNVGNTARECIEDILPSPMPQEEKVYSSQITFLSGDLSQEEVESIAKSLANPLIERINIKSREKFLADNGMGLVVPRVKIDEEPKADIVNILEASDEELQIIGKQGIANPDGTRRGPLALSLTYFKTIQDYFHEEGRNPTDVELEMLAQTWSEHCKHTIFADPMDDIREGIFKRYIRGATEKIRELKGKDDFCVSVFGDNAGGIIFDEYFLVSHKIETHNAPSALDPFGGSITGIVGVNRDQIGFGLGAKPVINVYGFCFADPREDIPLYKGPTFTQKMLSPRAIMDGVIEGVQVGGNCSGIPTPQGFVVFDERYRGKPLIYVGTVGLIPRESAGRPSHEKQAQPGDYVVMVGGRVGKDGIHGATFSSEAMDTGSPVTAVQIGDPITQKKLSDAIVKEARDMGLYNSITDNGAGGLSCSVAEMAEECGGCHVKLDDVPLKYPGLQPWETWISESQERMTLSVPPEKWEEFSDLMQRRSVEATIIGEFTDSGRCVVEYKNETVVDLDMGFLHHGLPPRPMKTTFTKPVHEEPDLSLSEDLTSTLHAMLSRPNLTSFEFISQQYDHEVQGGSVIKPLQGRGRVNGDASVTRIVLPSPGGVITTQGINPTYSDIDTHNMAACAIDTAIRNTIAVGGNLDHLAILDNFCWCSSDEPERLGQLERAARACYEFGVPLLTPFVSGKDSMYNDFKGYDKDGNPIKISVPPTLLISAIGVMEDASKAVSLDAKFPGDLVYILGETHDELGASEYFAMRGEQERGEKYIGNRVPEVDINKNKKRYIALSEATNQGLVASIQSVDRGGLAIALAETAMGGLLGMEVSLENLPGTFTRDDYGLFSGSQGRLVVTIAPQFKEQFEEIMQGNAYAQIGVIKEDGEFIVKGKEGGIIISDSTEAFLASYKSIFEDY